MEEQIKQSKARKIRDVILVFIIVMLINFIWSAVIGIVYGIIMVFRGVAITDSKLIINALSQNISFLTFSAVYNLFAIGVVFLFWRFADKRSLEELGFGITGKTGIQVFLGILAAIAAIILIIMFGTVFGIISFNSSGIRAYSGSQIAVSLLLGLLTFLMVGFGEETVYRAYIQKHIAEMAGNKLGLLIAALIFTSVHLFTYGKLLDLVDVFFAGIILGYAYILTRSIYLSAIFHFMWDYLQVSIFRLQDYEYYKGPVLIIFNNTGDLIINNFNFGNRLELVFILVEIIILALMYMFREKLRKLAI